MDHEMMSDAVYLKDPTTSGNRPARESTLVMPPPPVIYFKNIDFNDVFNHLGE